MASRSFADLLLRVAVDSSKVGAGLAGIESMTKKSISNLERSLDQLGKKMTQVGQSMSMKVTAPLVGLGIGAFKVAGDFDQAFRKVNVMLGASQDEAEKYKKRILEMSDATALSATDISDAFYQIVSAGYRGADSLDILETAMKGAVGGAADAQQTTAALTKAMNQFGLEGVAGATKAMDVFFGIVDQGLLSFEQLSTVFPQSATLAAGLGISIEETGAALATLTKTMGTVDEAGTALNATYTALIGPSEQMQELFTEWGVTTGPEAIAKFGGLAGVLKEVQKEAGDNVARLRELFPNVRAIKAALPLVTTNAEAFGEALDSLADNTGRTSEAFEEMASGPGFKFNQAMTQSKNSLLRLGDAISGTIAPVITGFVGVIKSAVSIFTALPGPIKTAATVTAMLAAAVGPLLIVFGMMASGVSNLIKLYTFLTAKTTAHTVALLRQRAAMIATRIASSGLAMGVAGLATAVGVGLVMAFTSFNKKTKTSTDRIRDFVQSLKEGGIGAVDMIPQIEALQAKIEELAASADPNKAGKIAAAEQEIANLIAQDEAIATKVQDELDQLILDKAELDKKLADLFKAAARFPTADWSKNFDDLQKLIDDVTEQIELRQGWLEKGVEAVTKAATEGAEKGIKVLSDLTNETLKILEDQLEAEQKTLEKMQTQFDRDTRASFGFRKELVRLTDEVEDARDALEDQEDMLSDVERAYDLASRKVERLRDSIRSLTDALYTGEGAFGDAVADLDLQIKQFRLQKVQAELAGLDTEALDEQINKLQLRREKLTLEWEIEHDPLDRAIDKAISKIEGTDIEIDPAAILQGVEDLGKELALALSDEDFWKNAVKIQTENVEEYTRKLTTAETALDGLNDKIDELSETAQENIDGQQELIDGLSDSIDLVKQKIPDTMTTLSQSLQGIRPQLDTAFNGFKAGLITSKTLIEEIQALLALESLKGAGEALAEDLKESPFGAQLESFFSSLKTPTATAGINEPTAMYNIAPSPQKADITVVVGGKTVADVMDVELDKRRRIQVV